MTARGLLGLGLGIVPLLVAAAEPLAKPTLFRVAMVGYLFDENKEQMLRQMGPFIEDMQRDTGTKAEFVIIDDLPALTRELKEGRVQVAILPSLDFGWLRAEVPNLKPLLLAGVDGGRLRAQVFVPAKSTLASLAELKGQALAWPRRNPQHVRFFLEREFGAAPEKAFQLQEARNIDQALEDTIDGKVKAAVVNFSAAKVFAEQKPGRFGRLKLLAESTDFPAPVVAYVPSAGEEERVRKFADAMKKSNQTESGRQTLTLWKLKGFEDLPADFEEQVTAILKKYPKP